MRWQLSWGDKYDKLVATVKDVHEKPFVKDAITLTTVQQIYAEAFLDLNNSRQVGMGISPIPFSELKAYIKLYKINDYEEFIWIITHLDNEYVKIQNDKSTKGK